MLKNTSAWSWMGFAGVGGLLVVVAYLLEGGTVQADGLRSMLMIAGVILVVAGGVNLIDWVAEKAIDRLDQVRRAMAITPETKMIDRIGTLTPEQCALLRDEALVIRTVVGGSGPLYYLTLPGDHEVPMSFVRLFMQLSSGGYLAPIRSWGEGTIQRENAQALTHFLILHGYADTARGNLPARWLDRRAALVRMGLDEMAASGDAEVEGEGEIEGEIDGDDERR